MSDSSPLAPESDEVEAEVRRLFAPLTADQQRIVDVTAHAFFVSDRRWPTFQHVEVEFDREGLDAKAVLSTFPLFVGSVRYGAFSALSWWGNLRDETPLEMSLLGLHHYGGPFKALADTLVRDILRLLQVFVEARQSFRTSPTEVGQLELTSTEALGRLRQVQHALPSADLLASFMKSEPPFFTSGGNRSGGDAEETWTWMVGRSVLDYAGVGLDLEEYLRRLVAKYRSPQSSGARAIASPLSLPASLGYLDTAWRVVPQHHAHLVVMPSPERSASLAFNATSREEYLERISAIGDVLKSLNVPKGGAQRGGHALERLRAYLFAVLALESRPRVTEALDRLDLVRRIRNGGGHAEAEPDALLAYRSLGIVLPIRDWDAAWETVRSRTIEALDALRDEILSFVDTPADDPEK